MNISDARALPLYQLVQSLGGTYSHTDRNKHDWYFSPFRPKEKTASFKINEERGKWFDFGHVASTANGNSSGGDILDLWCDYHGIDRRQGIAEALAALQAFAGPVAAQAREGVYKRPVTRLKDDGKQPAGAARFTVLKLHDQIFYKGLLTELAKRRIAPEFASRYLRQAYIRDSVYPDRKLNGFAFGNDKGGLELSCPNPKKGTSFKTSTRPKAPTTFRALISTKLFVFEGFWDFLSWMQMQDTPEPEHNIVVLNSLSFCGDIVPQIIAAKEQLETVMLFLDNDGAGRKATHFMAEELNNAGFTVRQMESLYQNYKDFSDYWAKDPGAKKVTEQQQVERRYYTDDSATAMVMNRSNAERPRYA